MRWTWIVIGAISLSSFVASQAEAKYPVLSLFTGRADGPYQPAPRRYIVVDPVPVEPAPAGRHHGHGGAPVAANDPPLWRRQDAVTPIYPYGWFGARHANERQTRGSYYEDYEDTAILRGR